MVQSRRLHLAIAVAVAAAVSAVAAVSAHAQGPITESNWQNHPRIVEIRKIVVEIDTLISEGSLAKKQAGQEYSEPYVDVLRQAFVDAKQIIRKFVRSAGSDDSAITGNYYYDGSGHLRFAYYLGAAVNGTRIQHRIYFDTHGNKIWEIQKLVEGPGYTFPTEWPAEDIVFDPSKLSLEKW